MADETDDSQKTEDPSSRKLQRARSQGQVVQSREINTWFMLSAGAAIVLLLGPGIAAALQRTLAAFVALEPLADGGISWVLVRGRLVEVAAALVLPMLLAVGAALGGALVQTGLVFAADKFNFDLSRLSPLAGFKRLFSVRSLVDLLKNLAKVAVVAAILGWLVLPEFDRLAELPTIPVTALPAEIRRQVMKLTLAVLAVLTAIAMSDYLYQRFAFLRQMRMSKQEVKEEFRQAEGDPMVKARLRQIRMDRARRRMMAAVPTASVVVTNPTHFAVALKYEMGEKGAPRVVAKGQDLIAQRIREIAQDAEVPVVENPPLARALYAGVEIDREIPPEHYRAVAEIIGYVFRLKGKIKGPAVAPAASVVR
jgi:flagellar biosynthesis protein FlhB